MNANTTLDYVLINSNPPDYVQRETFPHDPASELPALYGNEAFDFEIRLDGRMLYANTTGTSTATANAFNYTVTSSGPPLNPAGNITVDIEPGVDGGYETAVTDMVAYWDDFTNTDFVNGVANTFSGAAGFYGTITVWNHKIRWENVEWANWTSPFNLGFFNDQSQGTGNFWATYNANTYPEQIVIYPAYDVDQGLNASYPTTIANTVPYFVPPTSNNATSNTTTGSSTSSIPTGAITEIEILNGYPPSTLIEVLPDDHPLTLRNEGYEIANPAQPDGSEPYNIYYSKPPAPAWINPQPTFTYQLIDSPRRDSANNYVTGEGLNAFMRIWRQSTYPNGDPVDPGSVHDNGITYQWYAYNITVTDGGKNYAIGDTFEAVMDVPHPTATDIPFQWRVKNIDAPGANVAITNIVWDTAASDPNPYVNITTGVNTIRFEKNQIKIWPEEKYIFNEYRDGVENPDSLVTSNVAFDDASTYYSGRPSDEDTLLKQWYVPDDERNQQTSIEEFEYVFNVTSGDPTVTDYTSNNAPQEVRDLRLKQRYYWSTRPGKDILENVLPESPSSNTAFTP